jgi:hypothetical protein
MKQKALLVMAALVLMVSGVAAVSAYEAHLVNVTAHVENALDTPAPMAIGGVAAFPQEWLYEDMLITTSGSFKGQSRVNEVEFLIFAEPIYELSVAGDPYLWAGGFTYVSTDGGATWEWIGPTADFSEPVAGFVCTTLTGVASNSADGVIRVAMDMPVDPAYYNELTDPCDKPRPDTGQNNPQNPDQTGTSDGHQYCQAPSVVQDYDVAGDEFGLDIKIQVTDIR